MRRNLFIFIILLFGSIQNEKAIAMLGVDILQDDTQQQPNPCRVIKRTKGYKPPEDPKSLVPAKETSLPQGPFFYDQTRKMWYSGTNENVSLSNADLDSPPPCTSEIMNLAD